MKCLILTFLDFSSAMIYLCLWEARTSPLQLVCIHPKNHTSTIEEEIITINKWINYQTCYCIARSYCLYYTTCEYGYCLHTPIRRHFNPTTESLLLASWYRSSCCMYVSRPCLGSSSIVIMTQSSCLVDKHAHEYIYVRINTHT